MNTDEHESARWRERAGYPLDRVLETLPQQHILSFRKNLNATTNEHG